MSKWGDAILKIAKANPDINVEDEPPRPPIIIDHKANTVQVAEKRRIRRNGKYNARKVTIDGNKFDSAAEARTYAELQLRQERGEISDLELHPRFELLPAFTDCNGDKVRAAKYTADFAYTSRDGKRVIVDVKGGKATQTQAFNLRWKMLRYKYRDSDKYRFELWER